MLHGREMVLPTMQSLRAKLPQEIRETDHAPRLENLKSKLRTADKLARDHGSKKHAENKRYYDRNAKEREFAVGDMVYLYNPAIKVGVCSKFRRPWIGPWRIIEKSRLNYVITDQRGKQLVVDVNRLKGACDPVEWQVTKREKTERNVRPKRRQQNVEYPEVSSIGPKPVREPQVENLPRGESDYEAPNFGHPHTKFFTQRNT